MLKPPSSPPHQDNPAWAYRVPDDEVEASISHALHRASKGENLPLAGKTFAVKSNIDVAGVPTAAACPTTATIPAQHSTVVQRLLDAGATLAGTTNMDQFATGLVGTRSPIGVVHASGLPDHVAGGSSSGSAVVVADGHVDFSLGTDTAGSGRVPAAFNGIIGIKPSLGLIPTTGVLPACADFDCVSIFAKEADEAAQVFRVLSGTDEGDPRSRQRREDVPLAPPLKPSLGIPREADLQDLSLEYREGWTRTLAAVQGAGIETIEVNIAPLLDVAKLLYDGALVAERFAAVGHLVSGEAPDLDPNVRDIILNSRDHNAVEFVNDLEAVAEARSYSERLLEGLDALLVPTTTEHPTIIQVEEDPLEINKRLGTYTNSCNLLRMCGVAVPGASASGRFGVMVLGLEDHDQVVCDLAIRLHDAVKSPDEDRKESGTTAEIWPDLDTRLAVFGAHLRGQPLHHQLEDIGARLLGEIRTASNYRLFALDTEPPKPGLVRAEVGDQQNSITGELYRLPFSGVGKLLASLPAPMSLTTVVLDGGQEVIGFSCTPDALNGSREITAYADWRVYQTAIADKNNRKVSVPC